MKLPITTKILQDWGGAVTFRDGKTLYERGLVLDATCDATRIEGTLSWGSRSISVEMGSAIASIRRNMLNPRIAVKAKPAIIGGMPIRCPRSPT